MAKKRVMLSFDEELLEKMEKACKSQGITKSAYVSMVVSKDLGDTQKLLAEFRKQLEELVRDAGLDAQ